MKEKDLDVIDKPTWCPGCGNFGILSAVREAAAKSKLRREKIFLVSGIGCSSKLPHWIGLPGYHSIHGRPIPVATGIKLSNHKLTVIAESGDGDGYGIGLSHFINACRRNLDITYIVHNNKVYGLTQGQTSPTSDQGFKTRSTPSGVLEEPINPIALAISSGASYVARGYAGKIDHLADLILNGMRHKGFAIIDVLQPCVTFNKVNTYEFYNERTYQLEKTRYDPKNKEKAIKKAHEWGKKIPIGLFYKEKKPTYGDGLPQIRKKALVEQDISNIDISKIIEDAK